MIGAAVVAVLATGSAHLWQATTRLRGFFVHHHGVRSSVSVAGGPVPAEALTVRLNGDLQALRRLFENEDAIRDGQKAPHRILVIGTGGGMCCIRAAAYLATWRDAGLSQAIDHAITVSGSGGAAGAYLSGRPHRAIQMFEHLAVSGFVAGNSWYRRRGPVAGNEKKLPITSARPRQVQTNTAPSVPLLRTGFVQT